MHPCLPAKQTGTEIKCTVSRQWACLFTSGGVHLTATATPFLGYVLRCVPSTFGHLMTGQTNKKWMGLRELVSWNRAFSYIKALLHGNNVLLL